MKKMIIIVLILSIYGCTNVPKEQTKETAPVLELPYDVFLTTVKYDSCEYIVCNKSCRSASIIHKANCKNPIHKTSTK